MGWFLFVVLSFMLSHFPSHTSSLVPLCNDDEASALLRFKSLFNKTCGENFFRCESYFPKTESWENGTNCCLWDGVSCDTKSGHVIGLDLSCSCLQGEFHPNNTLFQLTYLQRLNLGYNDFLKSPMPSEFGDLVALTHLDLSGPGGFKGVIPSKISHLSKLVSLDLSNSYSPDHSTSYSVILPTSFQLDLPRKMMLEMIFETATLEKLIANATDLRELTLDGVDMSSIKPTTLSLLVNFSSSLASLSLQGTGLQGKLPNNILCLPNLQKLDLSYNNNLEGELPKFNWSTPLRYLDLSVTAFSGKVSDSISHLKSLQHLGLASSNFQGPVLLFLSNLTQLNYLNLANNHFSGEIPLSLSNLQHLTFIGLSLNNFGGEIPLSLSNVQHLTHIDLSLNNFGGEIPDLFGNVSKLEILELSANNLVGKLPSSLFGLTQLRVLTCSDNKIVGSIPDNIVSRLSNLTHLDLSNNSLNGKIPHWFVSLSSLSELDLSRNQLSGPIPEFSGFSLKRCDLSQNNLQGNIPRSMFHQKNLTELILSSNNLSGLVEFHEFSNLHSLWELDLSFNNSLSLSFTSGGNYTFPSLQYLYLSSNNLSGLAEFHEFSNLHSLWELDLSSNKSLSLSFTIGGDYTFPSLEYLYLSSCNINSFPKFLSRLKNLRVLDLSQNQIHGRIPKWFNNTGKDTLFSLDLSHNLLTSVGDLSLSWMGLNYIDLSFNMLEGHIPLPPSAIQFFSVSNNKLTGHISSAICNTSSLEMLILSHNNLTGKLPQCIGTLPHLSVLDMQSNKLSGIIPKTYLEIEELKTMNFNGNQLEGPLPRAVVKCKQLRLLDLGENNIQDTFPGWLESLQQLQVLVLAANRFHGTISCFNSNNTFPKLQVFDISNNNFSGNFPTVCIKKFKGMMVNFNNNGLQYMNSESYYLKPYNDSCVVTIKDKKIHLERIITSFTSIDLSYNRFEGVIPAIVGELKSLKGLSLSHNRITGSIPQTIGGLENLEWLDLSSNMLTGEIPMALTNLNFLSVLNLSQNQLVGMIPTGKQFNTFQSDSYQDNPGLCGTPLSKSCHRDEKQSTDSATFQHDEEFGFDWKPVVIGYACGGVFGILLGYIVFFVWKPQWSIRFVACILNQRVRNKTHRSNASRRRQNQGR